MGKKYRHKLNMLEPGVKLCKAAALLGLAGGALLICGVKTAGSVLLGAAGLALLVLLVLVGVELHQDEQLYLEAKKNDPEIK